MPEDQDKYQEPVAERPTALEAEPQPEKEVSIPKEQEDLELKRETAEEKVETTKEKTIEAEPAKEELKEEIGQPAPSPPSAQAQKQIKKLKDLDQQNQVNELCDLAFQKGLDFAIEVAKGLDNAYVLDELHDTLVDELYKKLVEQGKLKRI